MHLLRLFLGILLPAFLASPLWATGPVMVETDRGAAVFDPWVWQMRGVLATADLPVCIAADGTGMWLSKVGHPRQIELHSLSSGAKVLGPLDLPGTIMPQAMAMDPTESRLWLAYENLTPQGVQAHGVALVDLKAATVTADLAVFGIPQGLLLLPSEGARAQQLLMTAYIPELNKGMLYALTPDLMASVQSADMPGKPGALHYVPLALASQPATVSPTAQLTAGIVSSPRAVFSSPMPVADSPVAEAQGSTRASKGFKNPFNPLKGAFFGQVRDAQGKAVAGALLRATNRRGQAFEATSDTQGAYRLGPLSFGTYQVSAEAGGFKRRILSEQVLLEGAKTLDLALDAEGQ